MGEVEACGGGTGVAEGAGEAAAVGYVVISGNVADDVENTGPGKLMAELTGLAGKSDVENAGGKDEDVKRSKF